MKKLHPNIVSAAKANNLARHERAVERYYLNPKTCRQCAGVIPLKGSSYVTRKKVFCSHSCSAIHHNSGRRLKPKPCGYCKVEFVAHDNETHCSHTCSQGTRRKTYIERWLAGKEDGNRGSFRDALSQYVRRWLIETRGEKCEKCGWKEVNTKTGKIPLQIDHIDGDYRRTVPENLEILCPNCHSLTPTYGGSNRGKGREGRRDRRLRKRNAGLAEK